MTMLAEYGTLSLAEVLAPAIQMADGYPIEAQTANTIETQQGARSSSGSSRPAIMLHAPRRAAREAPGGGRDLRAEGPRGDAPQAGRGGARRRCARARRGRQAIYAAYDRFYKGDIAQRARARRARGRRAVHDAGPRQLEGADRGAASARRYKGDRGLQAPDLAAGPGDAAGAQHPRRTRTSRRWATTRRSTSTRCTRR